MKKLLLGLMLLTSVVGFSQETNFPGNKVELLLNKEVRVEEKGEYGQKHGYYHFYKDEKLTKTFSPNKHYGSKYLSLVNKVFTVIKYEQFTKNGQNKFKLSLNNAETGIIYYEYNPNEKYSFEFEVIGGLTFPENFYCEQISKTVDNFTNEIKYRATYKNILLNKIIEGKDTVLYLRLETKGYSLNVGINGLTLLLENNIKIEKPNDKINVTVGRNGDYIYSAFIRLTNEDINLLLNNQIKAFRLYIYDNYYEDGKVIQEYLKCLTK